MSVNTTARTVILALAAALLLAAVTLFILFRTVIPAPADTEPTPAFTIRAYEGQVAVFEGSSDYPMQVFDSPVEALPAEEQERLRAGIPAADRDELSVLLEDYTS